MENWSTKSPEPNYRPDFRPLPESFYLESSLVVARNLLGKGIVRRCRGKTLVAQIVETEAYMGDEDPASHAYRRRTPRNKVMFERGGACYVYLSYGMNFCMNVVTGLEGQGQAVLLRAAIPLVGKEQMRRNRGLDTSADIRKIASGPGKLTEALAVDLRFYGTRFDEGPLKIVDLGIHYNDAEIVAGPRIGISLAKELPYRFSVRHSPHLSRRCV